MSPSNGIPLPVYEVCPRKFLSVFSLYLGVDSSESVALHLPIEHDKTPGHIAICNDDYKFTAFSHSILQELIVNEVMGMFHSEIVVTLHVQCTCSYKVLRMIASITCKLEVSWDPGINLTFRGADLTRFAACSYLNLSSPTTNPPQKPAPPPPPLP